jgi:hypothetical protein
MAVRLGAPTFSGTGGAFKLGRTGFTYPAGSQVSYFDDPATAWRVALVRVPHSGYAHPWTLHIVCERGEILGIPAKILMDAEREHFA